MTLNLPALVRVLTEVHEGWVVGTSANPSIDLSTVKDFDVAVPRKHWDAAALLIPKDSQPNTFGGWKVPRAQPIDVWPSDLSCFSSYKTPWMWHPKSGTRLKRWEGQ